MESDSKNSPYTKQRDDNQNKKLTLQLFDEKRNSFNNADKINLKPITNNQSAMFKSARISPNDITQSQKYSPNRSQGHGNSNQISQHLNLDPLKMNLNNKSHHNKDRSSDLSRSQSNDSVVSVRAAELRQAVKEFDKPQNKKIDAEKVRHAKLQSVIELIKQKGSFHPKRHQDTEDFNFNNQNVLEKGSSFGKQNFVPSPKASTITEGTFNKSKTLNRYQSTSNSNKKKPTRRQTEIFTMFNDHHELQKLIYEMFEDKASDTHQDTMQKRSLSSALSKEPHQRKNKEIQDLKKYFIKFKYFKELAEKYGENPLKEILKIIQVKRVDKNKYIIEEGETGDRFYIILKGSVNVLKQYEVQVTNTNTSISKTSTEKIHDYLQFLYDNMDDIQWQMVPYAKMILKHFNQVQLYKQQLVIDLQNIIFQKIQKSILRRMQFHKMNSILQISQVLQDTQSNLSFVRSATQFNYGRSSQGRNRSSAFDSAGQDEKSSNAIQRQSTIIQTQQNENKNNDNKSGTFRHQPIIESIDDDITKLVTEKLMTEPDKINEEQDSRISDSVSEKMKLYNQKLIEHGKSKSIRATPFDIKGKLMKRLYKMSAVIDLRYTYMNKKVGEMKQETSFGEIALLQNVQRVVSCQTNEESIFAYLDKEDFNRVLKHIEKQEQQQKMGILKKNQFFESLSSNKLLKLLRLINTFYPTNKSYIYREGDRVDGIYLVGYGSVKYMKDSEFQIPIECKTKNKWMKAQVRQNGLNRKKGMKDIAIFEKNDIIGFEELYREIVIMKRYENETGKEINVNNQASYADNPLFSQKRDFSCQVNSNQIQILFIKKEDLLPFIYYNKDNTIEKLFIERSQILRRSIELIEKTQNFVHGSLPDQFIESLNSRPTKKKKIFDETRKVIEHKGSKTHLPADSMLDVGEISSATQSIEKYQSIITSPLQFFNEKNSIEEIKFIQTNFDRSNSSTPNKSDIKRKVLSGQGNIDIYHNLENTNTITKEALSKSNTRNDNILVNIQDKSNENIQQLRPKINISQRPEFNVNQSLNLNELPMMQENKKNSIQYQHNLNRKGFTNSLDPSKQSIYDHSLTIREQRKQNKNQFPTMVSKDFESARIQLSNIVDDKFDQKIKDNLNNSVNTMLNELNTTPTKELIPSIHTITKKSKLAGLNQVILQSAKSSVMKNFAIQNQTFGSIGKFSKQQHKVTKSCIEGRDSLNTSKKLDDFFYESNRSYNQAQLYSRASQENLKKQKKQRYTQQQKIVSADFSEQNILPIKIPLIEKDNSSLYLKDIKNFLGLKKVADNCTQRKQLQYSMESARYLNANNQMYVQEKNGGQILKSLYDQNEKQDSISSVPIQKIDKELDSRLFGVLQSIQTDNFYQYIDAEKGIKENDRQMMNRLNKKLTRDMNDIDEVYRQMDETDKLHGYKKHRAIQVSIDKEQLEMIQKRIRDKIKEGHSYLSPPLIQKFKEQQDLDLVKRQQMKDKLRSKIIRGTVVVNCHNIKDFEEQHNQKVQIPGGRLVSLQKYQDIRDQSVKNLGYNDSKNKVKITNQPRFYSIEELKSMQSRNNQNFTKQSYESVLRDTSQVVNSNMKPVFRAGEQNSCLSQVEKKQQSINLIDLSPPNQQQPLREIRTTINVPKKTQVDNVFEKQSYGTGLEISEFKKFRVINQRGADSSNKNQQNLTNKDQNTQNTFSDGHNPTLADNSLISTGKNFKSTAQNIKLDYLDKTGEFTKKSEVTISQILKTNNNINTSQILK